LADAGDLIDQDAMDRLGLTIDQRQRFLVRKFTYSNWESGGRLWGGFWMNGLKSKHRPEVLRMNGETTVELDFDAVIVNLAYIVAGQNIPANDPYIIPGLSPASRPAIKKTLAALLFDKKPTRKALPTKGGDVRQLLSPEDQRKTYREIYTLI